MDDRLDPYTSILRSTRHQIKNVVFSAGGLKGFCYIGALRELCEGSEEVWSDFVGGLEHVAGTSIGSVAAVITTLGCPIKKVEEFLLSYDLENLVNKPSTGVLFPRIWSWVSKTSQGHSFNLPLDSQYYLADGSGLERFYKSILNHLAGDPHITLKELKERTNRSTHLFACSYRKRCAVDLCAETYPHLPVWKAMRASSAIPVLFAPVEIAGELFVDGGIVMYTPHYDFDFSHTLTLKIQVPALKETSFLEFVYCQWECLFEGQSATLMKRYPQIWSHLIVISSSSFSLKNLFDNEIPKETIYKSFLEGKVAVKMFALRTIFVLSMALSISKRKLQSLRRPPLTFTQSSGHKE